MQTISIRLLEFLLRVCLCNSDYKDDSKLLILFSCINTFIIYSRIIYCQFLCRSVLNIIKSCHGDITTTTKSRHGRSKLFWIRKTTAWIDLVF